MKLDARTAPIHAVLESYLEPKHLAYALRLWNDKFIEQPNVSLKAFVDSFYDRQPVSLRSHELYNELLPAMMEAFRVRIHYKGDLIEPYDFPDYDLGSVGAASVSAEQPLSNTDDSPPAVISEPAAQQQVKQVGLDATQQQVQVKQVEPDATQGQVESRVTQASQNQ